MVRPGASVCSLKALALLLAAGALLGAASQPAAYGKWRRLSSPRASQSRPAQAGKPAPPSNVDWPNVGNDKGGTRYSPLRQITTDNVSKLQLAWTYDTPAPVAPSSRGSGAEESDQPAPGRGAAPRTDGSNRPAPRQSERGGADERDKPVRSTRGNLRARAGTASAGSAPHTAEPRASARRLSSSASRQSAERGARRSASRRCRGQRDGQERTPRWRSSGPMVVPTAPQLGSVSASQPQKARAGAASPGSAHSRASSGRASSLELGTSPVGVRGAWRSASRRCRGQTRRAGANAALALVGADGGGDEHRNSVRSARANLRGRVRQARAPPTVEPRAGARRLSVAR